MFDGLDGRFIFEEFFKSALDIHIICKPDGKVGFANPKWTDVLGWDTQELVDQYLIDFVLPADVEYTLTCCDKIKACSDVFEFENRLKHKRGGYRWIKWISRQNNEYIYISGHDITALKRNELFLRDVEISARVLGWRMELPSREITWSHPRNVIIGFPHPRTLTDLLQMDFINSQHRDNLAKAFEKLLSGETSLTLDVGINTKFDSMAWLRFRASTQIEMGKVLSISGTVQEVTEMRSISREFLNQKARLERLMKNTPGMVYQFRLNPDGSTRMEFVSEMVYEIYEISPEDFNANPNLPLEMVHPDDIEPLFALIQQSAKNLTEFDWRGRILTRNGKEKWIKAQSNPELQEDGSVLWDGFVIDITRQVRNERESAEQALVAQHQSRLASVGLLAAGVGHEINNPLSVIMGKIWTMEKELTKSEPSLEDLANAIEKQKVAVARIQKIIDGLRSFTRIDKVEESTCWANEVTSQALLMMEEIFIKEKLHISFELLTKDCRVRCGAGQLQQVLMNLISNARDATEGQELREVSIRIQSRDPRKIEFIISDNGVGMTPEAQKRIFEPFYTTKQVGRGTGLGLGISKSLAQSWGGDLVLLASQPGIGTTFKFSIPAKLMEQMDFAESAGGHLPLNDRALDRKLRVLVVEHDLEVQTLIRDVCMECGSDVALARNGEEALDLIPQLGPLDLVLTDLNMPKLDGEKLIDQILALYLGPARPQIFVITANPIQEMDRAGRLADGIFLKPFEPEALMNLLRQVAKGRPGDKIASPDALIYPERPLPVP